MEEIRDQQFRDEHVPTDGKTFVNCRFNDVQLGYAGGPHPIFRDCEMDGAGWHFEGAALKTVQLIQANGNGEGGRNFIYELFRPGFYLND